MPAQKIWHKNGVLAEYIREEALIYWLVDKVSDRKNDMEWSDFETYLSELDIKAVFEKWGYTLENVMKVQETLADIAGLFFDWVHTIDLTQAEKKDSIETLLQKDKYLILTFNYTETFEKVYGVSEENICYIHGERESGEEEQRRKKMVPFGKNNCELMVGYEEKLFDIEKFDMEFANSNIRSGILAAITGLIKDVEQNINRKKSFFDSVEKQAIENVYSIGFSYSDVDMPYIREICEKMDKSGSMDKCIWYFEKYDSPERRDMFEKKVKAAGYTGNFSGFKM